MIAVVIVSQKISGIGNFDERSQAPALMNTPLKLRLMMTKLIWNNDFFLRFGSLSLKKKILEFLKTYLVYDVRQKIATPFKIGNIGRVGDQYRLCNTVVSLNLEGINFRWESDKVKITISSLRRFVLMIL